MSYLASSRHVDPVVLPTLGREISVLDDLKSFSALRKMISEFKPHVIHTHTAKAGTLGRLAGISVNAQRIFGQKIRLVHTFHGHVFHSYFSSFKTSTFIKIERLLARFTDRIIVISSSQEKDICENYKIAKPHQVQVVPLGFDLSGFERLSPPVSHEVFSVGIIGRLAPVKNHRMLFETVKTLKDQGADHVFKFFVVGDGELREALTQEVTALGVEKNVLFTGWQKEMPGVYQKLDAVVLTSLNEGTPVSLIEAMAAARPVIATDVGGVRDLMGEIDRERGEGYKLARHGILVPSGGSKALAEALLFALRERTSVNQIAERAREHAIHNYSLDRLARDMEALYEELVKGE
jgi:glycosyltransferase involved in cell wall biosynthesis